MPRRGVLLGPAVRALGSAAGKHEAEARRDQEDHGDDEDGEEGAESEDEADVADHAPGPGRGRDGHHPDGGGGLGRTQGHGHGVEARPARRDGFLSWRWISMRVKRGMPKS